MPQAGNDHPDDGDLDVGPGLIEDEEIEALLFRETEEAVLGLLLAPGTAHFGCPAADQRP